MGQGKVLSAFHLNGTKPQTVFAAFWVNVCTHHSTLNSTFHVLTA